MINYQNEKEFRNNVYSGKNVTESDCSRHLSYLKSNNTIRFANKLDVCIFNAKGMPRPKGKIYRENPMISTVEQTQDTHLITQDTEKTEEISSVKNKPFVLKRIFRKK